MALKALSRLYPEYSTKRRMLKRLNVLNQAGCRLVPRSFSRLAAAERFMPEIGKTQTRAVMLHKINQSNRAYFFDHHSDGHLLAVTKLALTEAAAKGIRREAEILRAIAGRTAFQTPDVLAFQSWQGGCLLQVSAVPECHTRHDKAHPLPEALFQAVAALRPSDAPAMLPAAAFDGWQEMRSRVTEPTIRAIADAIDPEGLYDAAPAHRDIGSENVFSQAPARELTDFWLIDWEFFTDTAPALTDRIGEWLGRHHRTLKGLGRGRQRTGLAAKFLEDFGDTPGGQSAAVLALLHLAALGIDLARELIRDDMGAA